MIKIDGSYGEGGGQIIRTAIALSCVTNQPVRITDIRKNRSKPGLRRQHLTGINAAAQLCSAKVSGNKMHSTEVEFLPGEIKHGKFKFNVGTAGAITLVLQTLVPIAAFGKDNHSFEITGGTDVKWSPSADYFQHVFCNYMKQIGLKIHTETKGRGFFPKGRGVMRVVVYPWKEKKEYSHVKQGKLKKIDATAISSNELSSANVNKREVNAFGFHLNKELRKKIQSKNTSYVNSLSTGNVFHAHAHFKHAKLGVSVLGERGKKAEQVGAEVAKKLSEEIKSGATVDHRMADQILVYLALGKGGRFKTSRISNHLKTNALIIQKFLPKTKIKINKKNKTVEVT